ncbi:MAG: porin family protein [Prevotella sp.]|jgi:opacity protein-like surface antigen|nr:porin family protein [Prevotella sp.]
MKKSVQSIMLFSWLFLSSYQLYAQVPSPEQVQEKTPSPQHQFEIGLGVWSTSNVIYALSDMLIGSVNVDIENSSASPVYHLGYKYLLNERFSGGATLAFGQEKANAKGRTGSAYDIEGELKRYNVTLAAEADYKYIRNGKLSFYALAGFGCSWLHQRYSCSELSVQTDNNLSFDFQLTPIGVKFGDKFGGFGELGLGYKGILNNWRILENVMY